MIIGRSGELSALRRLCRSAAAGAGGVVLVEGIAGLGKTALLRALVAAVPDLRSWWGRVPEGGQAPAYWPWREIVAAAGWDVDWTDAQDTWSLGARVASAARAAAARQPLLLLVDDLHAADDDTVRMTGYLASVLQDSPVALVVASRPDERLSPLARTGTTLTLAPLAEDEADEIITLHAADPLPDRARAEIRAVAEGNPLVLRELSRGAGSGGMPREVRVTVEQRLAPLPPDDRDLVERAAVLGREIEVGVLTELTERSDGEVLESLDRLRRLGVVDGEGARWAFSHVVVRDAVHDGLSEPRRLELHRDAARAVAAVHPRRTTVQADHLLAAVPLVSVAVAVAAARHAAAQARSASAHDEAAGLLSRALGITVEDDDRLQVLLELGEALLAAGRVDQAVVHFEEAVGLAQRCDDEAARARALLGRSALLLTGMAEAVHLPSLADAAAIARAQGDRARLVRLLCRRATLLASSVDFAGALVEADEALDVARDLGDPLLLARALAAVHVSCWPPDLQDRAVRISAELVEAAAASGDLDLAMEAEIARMVDGLRGGDLAMMDDALSRAAAVAERSQSPRHQFFVLSRRATRALIVGRLSEAMSLLARAEEIGEAIQEPDTFQVYWGAQFLVLPETHSRDELLQFADFLEQFPQDDPLLHAVIANFHAMAGNAAHAAELLARALVGAEQITQHGDLAILTLMARVASQLGRPDLAVRVEHLLRPFAGRLVVNSGAVTFCGAVDHWLGLLVHVQGRVDDARELLTSALADYERMGATWFVRWTAAALQALEPAPAVAAPGRRHAVLRRLGDGWQVGWAGHEARVPDARGLHHLHALLSAAGGEVHAADLMRPGASAQLTPHAREALLDDTAKHAYRARIQQLQAVIAEAEDAGEIERRAEAQAEVDALLGELRRAVGLHGHDRQPADDAERARVAVRKAVTATLTRLAEHDASFATHLRSSVRTGLRCSYQPDPTIEISWSL